MIQRRVSLRRTGLRRREVRRAVGKRGGRTLKQPPALQRRRGELKELADFLFARYVKHRDGWRCVICGGAQSPQCAHGFSRRYHGTRWDPRNAWTLCSGCHVRYTYDPVGWDDWMIARLGWDLYLELRVQAQAVSRIDLVDLALQLRAVVHDEIPQRGMREVMELVMRASPGVVEASGGREDSD